MSSDIRYVGKPDKKVPLWRVLLYLALTAIALVAVAKCMNTKQAAPAQKAVISLR